MNVIYREEQRNRSKLHVQIHLMLQQEQLINKASLQSLNGNHEFVIFASMECCCWLGIQMGIWMKIGRAYCA
jgi:hypothetical protein